MTDIKTITLTRLNHNEPDFPQLNAMCKALQEFLQEEVEPSDSAWMANLETIIAFQAEDGSFRLLDSYQVPSDACVDFCHMPTYLCTAILMKAYLTDEALIGEEESLKDALNACCKGKLSGHGYDAFRGRIEALHVFMQAGVREFLMYHRNLSRKFAGMMAQIAADFQEREGKGNFHSGWDEGYESEIRIINHYFAYSNVFVYGTLMHGESNHNYFLREDWFVSRAVISVLKKDKKVFLYC